MEPKLEPTGLPVKFEEEMVPSDVTYDGCIPCITHHLY